MLYKDTNIEIEVVPPCAAFHVGELNLHEANITGADQIDEGESSLIEYGYMEEE